MITVTLTADVQLARVIAMHDPFQCSIPCWRMRVWNLLPPETTTTVQKLTPSQELEHQRRLNDMPIKVVTEKEAPQRLFKRGTVSSKQDYADVINALRSMKDGQALIVDMDAAAWTGVKKPETTFASNLRRYFESKNLAITAYQSGPNQITVRKATALDKHTGRGGKKKA